MKNWIHKKESRGQEVARIQKALSLAQDSHFGPQTEQAVRDFQSSAGLNIDGQVGPLTRRELEIEIYSGIDISKWNKIEDWKKLKASGMAEFCWIKATEGNDYLCAKYSTHVKNIIKAGVPYGAYHFARPDLHLDPHKEVKNFVKHSPIEKGNLRPVLDFEKAGNHDPDSIRNWVLTFLQEFEIQTGIRPLIYTGGNMTKYYLMRDTTGIDDYTLWHAYYPKNRDLTKGIKKDRLGGWKEWRIWQWTGSGTIEGAGSNIDRNWLVGGRAGFDEIIIS